MRLYRARFDPGMRPLRLRTPGACVHFRFGKTSMRPLRAGHASIPESAEPGLASISESAGPSLRPFRAALLRLRPADTVAARCQCSRAGGIVIPLQFVQDQGNEVNDRGSPAGHRNPLAGPRDAHAFAKAVPELAHADGLHTSITRSELALDTAARVTGSDPRGPNRGSP